MPVTSIHRATRLCAIASGVVLLANCGGGTSDSAATSNAVAQFLPTVTLVNTCASIQGMSISASLIGRPTRGAVVDSAVFHSSTESGNTFGAYCELQGHIKPVDTTAPDINFQVNLPNNWNFKAIHFGGSGFDGQVIDGTEKVRLSGSNSTPPLAMGYATYGDDSGHQAAEITDGSFAVNDEALANFGRDALKKTHDVAYELMKARYGTTATRAYFLGTSTGGRDALTYLQHWPTDYIGAVVNQPALNYTGVRMSNVAIGRALYNNGGAGWVNVNKTLLIQSTVMSQCDALDGVADGVISNIEACRQKNEDILASLRCSSGGDEGDTCLSDAQIETVRTVESPMELRSYSLPNGVVRSGGYNFLEGSQLTNGDRNFGTRAVPTVPPTKDVDANLFITGDQWTRYFLTRDANFNSLTFDPANPGTYLSRVQTVSSLTDASDPNMSAFFNNGGKLIMLHGLADEIQSTNNTIEFYNRLIAAVGQTTVANQVRFYTVPGYGHGTGVFKPAWDSLGALENWVENNIAPSNPVVTDTVSGNGGRSRPLCEYPAWPKYSGSGDVNAASSYSCVTETATPPACANFPSATTQYKGGDVWGEEVNVSINPGTLSYTITFNASLQRTTGSTRTGQLKPRGQCVYASAENGASFSFGAGGVIQGGVATPTGNQFLPLVAFRDTSSNFVDLANVYNSSGLQFGSSGTASSWNASTRFRSSAATWQMCRGTGSGFMLYDAACTNVSKGYISYNATRGAFDMYTTSPTAAATTTGGTLAGSVVAGMVNGAPVPLFLNRASTSSYGMQINAPQLSVASGSADGTYTSIHSAGSGSVTRIAGNAVTAAGKTGTMTYDSPVAGVISASGNASGNFIVTSGIYAFTGSSTLELGLHR